MNKTFSIGMPREGQWVLHKDRVGIVAGFDSKGRDLMVVVHLVDDDGFSGEIVRVRNAEDQIQPLLDKNLIPERRRKTLDSNFIPRR